MTSPGPVTPHSDTPDEWVRAALKALDWPADLEAVSGEEQMFRSLYWQVAYEVIDALRPLIAAEAVAGERNRIADAIEQHRDSVWGNFDSALVGPAHAAKNAYTEAARIARGDTT